jgi:hypothetical protein
MASADEHDVICFCGQDLWYHNRAHSDFQLMTRIARTRKVLLVNSLGMRVPMPGRSSQPLRRIFRKAKSMMRHRRTPLPDTPNYTVLSPVLFPFYGSEKMRRVDNLDAGWVGAGGRCGGRGGADAGVAVARGIG